MQPPRRRPAQESRTMPFGLIFGALFFGLFCGIFGMRLLSDSGPQAKLGGALLVVLGISLALGLLMRRNWARWCGVAVGLLAAGLSWRMVQTHAGVLEFVALFAALAVSVLLILPPTGDPSRGAPPAVAASASRIGPLGWTTLASFAGLLFVAAALESAPGTAAAREGALPASAIGKRVEWTDFASGMTRAETEGKPVLATFVTSWCPYCKKMSRQTWQSSAVTERLDAVVPVRVDVEGTEEGGRIAAQYGIAGYPVQMLLDPHGRVIARYDGFQGPGEFLDWIDRGLDRGAGASF